MKTVKRTERGWAGHFIGAQECGFRRNTLLQLGKKYIVVSTVGLYRFDGKIEQIGHDRYYETMAFWSDSSDKIYHDADVAKGVYADAKWSINKDDVDNFPDSIDIQANNMHEAYVEKVIEMLLNNEL